MTFTRFSFLLLITFTSTLNMGTACGSCPEGDNVFVEDFQDCAGIPCAWSADTGTLSGAGELVVPEGTTARRAVSAELGRIEFSAIDYRFRCEAGATLQLGASGPQPIILEAWETPPEGTITGTVSTSARIADGGPFLAEEIAFTAAGGACTIEALRAYNGMYCD